MLSIHSNELPCSKTWFLERGLRLEYSVKESERTRNLWLYDFQAMNIETNPKYITVKVNFSQSYLFESTSERFPGKRLLFWKFEYFYGIVILRNFENQVCIEMRSKCTLLGLFCFNVTLSLKSAKLITFLSGIPTRLEEFR